MLVKYIFKKVKNPNQVHTKEHAASSIYVNIAKFLSPIIYGTDHVYITDSVRR